jgi:hypothetical protein
MLILPNQNISLRSSIHDDDDGGRGDLFWGVRDVRGAQSRQDLSVYWRGEACGERPARGRGW